MAQKEHLDVWTYATANSVTTPGDLTSTYWPGMRVALKQGTLKYFVISAVVYSTPNTTITLDGFGTYTLTSATITAWPRHRLHLFSALPRYCAPLPHQH